MKVTGSLQNRSGTYYMMVRVPDENGVVKQKAKSTGIKVDAGTKRDTQQNKIQANKMLSK